MSKTAIVAVMVVLVVIVGAGAFYGGMKYQETTMRNSFASRFDGGMGGPEGAQG